MSRSLLEVAVNGRSEEWYIVVVSALAKSTWVVSYVFGLIHINWCRISSIYSIQFTVPNCKMTVFKDIPGLEYLQSLCV